MPDRIQAIKRMLEKTPQDVFLRYSLGMEYAAAGQHDQAAAEFESCIRLDPSYLPAYVEAGKNLRSAGRLAEARSVFEAALALAKATGQRHSADFVQQQLEGLPRP